MQLSLGPSCGIIRRCVTIPGIVHEQQFFIGTVVDILQRIVNRCLNNTTGKRKYLNRESELDLACAINVS
jgi:UDP-N-acetylglucosamine:LPS N-acetylglucosamine transferase